MPFQPGQDVHRIWIDHPVAHNVVAERAGHIGDQDGPVLVCKVMEGGRYRHGSQMKRNEVRGQRDVDRQFLPHHGNIVEPGC